MRSVDSGRLTVGGKSEEKIKSVAVPRELAERWAERMLRMMVKEQVEQMLETLELTFDQAVIRECEQEFTILLSRKGFPVKFGGTNWVKAYNPTMYKPE